MNKKLLVVSVLIGLLLISAVSAASTELKDRIRVRTNPVPELETSPVAGIDIDEIAGPRIGIPQPPRIPTKDDVGLYVFGERGTGIWGQSTDYSGVLGSSRDDTGVVGFTEKGYWAVWAYNKKADTTGWLGAYRTGVLGLVKNSKFFAGEFLGGKGVYSENGYATRYMGKEARLVPGQYTFETVDGKLVTVTNGIVTAIKSKV